MPRSKHARTVAKLSASLRKYWAKRRAERAAAQKAATPEAPKTDAAKVA